MEYGSWGRTEGERAALARAVGIDFGTSNSVICTLEGGEPVVIANAEGSRLTPSVVAFADDGEVLVGEPAQRQATRHPHRTFESIKRRIGRGQEMVGELRLSPLEVAAHIFRKLKQDAEVYLGESVTDAVLAVPATVFLSHREAIAEAAKMAGINVLRIIYEPTAAALAYGLDRTEEATIVIFDLGGGTLDVSLLEVGEGVVVVKATSGNDYLGGEDWTERIAEHLVQKFDELYSVDLAGDLTAMRRVREAAEQAKIDLSSASQTSIWLPWLAADQSGPLNLDVELTRREFEEMTSDLLELCKKPYRQVLKDRELNTTDVNHVVLVGGATRMPAVATAVRELSGGREPSRGVNPDEVVAIGAALQAGTLKGEFKEVLLLDVTSMSLGVETKRGDYVNLIGRNTLIPTKRSELFTTTANNQNVGAPPFLPGSP